MSDTSSILRMDDVIWLISAWHGNSLKVVPKELMKGSETASVSTVKGGLLSCDLIAIHGALLSDRAEYG